MAAHSRGEMRDAAFDELVSLGAPALEAARAIAYGEEQGDDQERSGSIELLARFDTPLVAAWLLELAETAEPAWLRWHAAYQLSRTSQDQVIPALVLRLKYEADYAAVLGLVTALLNLGNQSGLDALDVVAAGDTPQAEEARSLRARMVADLGLSDASELLAAWRAGDPDGLFHDPERSDRYRLEVWRWIGRFDEFQLRGVDDGRFVLSRLRGTAAGILAEALHEQDVYTRVHVAQCLERMGPRAAPAFDTLAAALAEPILAPYAAAALGRLGLPAAESALAARVGANTEPELRLAAVRALGFLAHPSVAETLRPLLAAEEPLEIRQAAAEGLVYAGAADEAVPFLRNLIETGGVEIGTSQAALRWHDDQAR